jgi:maltose O-acetyltransferase
VTLEHDLREEVANFDVRFVIGRFLIALIPPLVGNRLRTKILRLAGVSIGPGTTIGGTFSVHGGGRPASRIQIGANCWINDSCVLDASAAITIGNNVAFGQGVMILTNTHELGPSEYRAGPLVGLPVIVGDGVWVGARTTVLPGVTIGPGAIVAAGAVVNRSVAANTMVAGVPARLVRALDTS